MRTPAYKEGMKTLLSLLASSLLLLALALMIDPVRGSSPEPSTEEAPPLLPVAPAKRPAAAKAPSPTLPAATIAPTDLTRAMEAGRLCEASRLMVVSSPSSAKEAAAILASVGASSDLQELFSPAGPLFGGDAIPLAQLHHPLSRLYYALRLGGYYPGSTSPTEETRRRARDLLLALEKEDSGNAVYAFFLLPLEKTLGAKPDALRETAARAARASRFDALLPEKLAGLHLSRFSTPTHYMVLDAFLNQADSLSYWEPQANFIELDQTLGTDYAKQVGRLLREGGERATRGSAFFGFSAREFDAGYQMLRDGGPNSYQLSRELEHLAEGEDMPYGWVDSSNCDAEAYETFFQQMRERL